MLESAVNINNKVINYINFIYQRYLILRQVTILPQIASSVVTYYYVYEKVKISIGAIIRSYPFVYTHIIIIVVI